LITLVFYFLLLQHVTLVLAPSIFNFGRDARRISRNKRAKSCTPPESTPLAKAGFSG
jgi:hypothetical protein